MFIKAQYVCAMPTFVTDMLRYYTTVYNFIKTCLPSFVTEVLHFCTTV